MLKMPAGYNAWCVLCNKGFEFFEGLAKHNKESVEEHLKRSGKKNRRIEKKSDTTKPSATDL